MSLENLSPDHSVCEESLALVHAQIMLVKQRRAAQQGVETREIYLTAPEIFEIDEMVCNGDRLYGRTSKLR